MQGFFAEFILSEAEGLRIKDARPGQGVLALPDFLFPTRYSLPVLKGLAN
jgi:hypothetical protein